MSDPVAPWRASRGGDLRAAGHRHAAAVVVPVVPVAALRLLISGLDRKRGSYGLKEATLATALIDALGIAKDSPDAVRLTNWRRGGGERNAGNFALVAAECLFGILMVVYLPSLDSYPGYTPIRSELLVDNTDYEPLPGGEQICPERRANIFSSSG
ncbi:hypothetical protein ACQ4PT_047755 [Festuca glaucescens]